MSNPPIVRFTDGYEFGKRGRPESQESKDIAAALKANPNKWALVKSDAKNDGLATRIRKGQSPSFREGHFQAKASRNGDGTFTITARYLTPIEAKKEGLID